VEIANLSWMMIVMDLLADPITPKQSFEPIKPMEREALYIAKQKKKIQIKDGERTSDMGSTLTPHQSGLRIN